MPVKLAHRAKVVGRYYLRLNVDDRPGVMAEIAGILGRHAISIASVIQHQTEEGGASVVPWIFMTHAAAKGAMRQAVETINCLSSLHRAACGCGCMIEGKRKRQKSKTLLSSVFHPCLSVAAFGLLPFDF